MKFFVETMQQSASYARATGRLVAELLRHVALMGLVAVATLSTPAASAVELDLVWDPPAERVDGSPLTDLVGYHVYVSTNKGVYGTTYATAPSNSLALQNLSEGQTYYFVVTSIDSSGYESPPSSEFAWNSLDADLDGLPDAWELTAFGSTVASSGAGDEDADADGCSDQAEFVAGTNPTNAASAARLDIRMDQGRVVVEFSALEAVGPGYKDGTRLYAIEECSPAGFDWAPCGGLQSITGRNQLVSADIGEVARGLFRLKCWLNPATP